MAHFAEVDAQNQVLRVIVAEQDFINTLSGRWIQTSYNTHGGVHDGNGVPLRKNYAGIGYTYDESRDAFIPPKPYPSWTLDEASCLWISPIPYPTDGKAYLWDEAGQAWNVVEVIV